MTLVLIYVDDLLITGNSTASISELKKFLASNFHMKDLGPVTYFLGLEIDRSSNGFFISQKKYVLNLLQEFGMMQATPLKLPMETHIKLHLIRETCFQTQLNIKSFSGSLFT